MGKAIVGKWLVAFNDDGDLIQKPQTVEAYIAFNENPPCININLPDKEEVHYSIEIPLNKFMKLLSRGGKR